MTEENKNDTAVGKETPGDMPGVEVPAGAQVPGVNMTQGEEPVEETPVQTEQSQTEQPENNMTEDTATVPTIDPMEPVGPN